MVIGKCFEWRMNVARKKQLSEEEKQVWERFTIPVKGLKRDKYYYDSTLTSISFKRSATYKDDSEFNLNHLDGDTRKIFLNSFKKADTSFFIQHYKLFKEKQCHSKAVFTPIGEKNSGLDNSTWKRLQKGDIKPERTLDLHGFFAQQAFVMLEEFLVKAYRHHIRCVDIITGIGSGYKEGGILKKELPHWLNRPYIKTLILATLYVSPQNNGAVRVLLKRNR